MTTILASLNVEWMDTTAVQDESFERGEFQFHLWQMNQ
jgi:hypothetical protein